MRMRRRATCALFFLLIMATAPQAQGEEAGRYQCVSLGTSDAVFIIDTREGHVWTWTGNPRIEHEGYVGIIYQGKVRPGNKTGTLIGEIDPSKR